MDSFRVPCTQAPFEVIPYNGPPEPKQPSRRNTSKALLSKDTRRSNTLLKNNEHLESTWAEIKVVNLFHKDNSSGSRGKANSDISSCDEFAPQNESGGEEAKRNSRQGTDDDSSNQLAPFENISQKYTVIIEDSQPSVDTDEGDSQKNDAGTQRSDRLGGLGIEQPTQGYPTTFENTSSSDTDGDHDDCGNQIVRPTLKRERSPPTKPYVRLSNTTSKQRLKRNVRLAKQRRLPSSGGRTSFNRALTLDHLSGPLYDRYDAKMYNSDDSSERRLRKRKRKCIQNTTDENDKYEEYEVEGILDSRLYCGKIQYQAKWAGYEEDLKWYNASNFKNSPHRLWDFHEANPSHPGPPKKLEDWIRCWEIACDHPDDDEPKKLNN